MSWTHFVEQSEQYCEDTLSTASSYLLAQQQDELCMILALSNLRVWEGWDEWDEGRMPCFNKNDQWECKAILQVEPTLLPDLDDEAKGLLGDAIEASLEPTQGKLAHLVSFSVTIKRVQAHETWREELRSLLESGKSLNQGKFISDDKVISWNGMRFASMEEMMLAKSLEEVKRKSGDKLKLLYFPNCLARLLVDGAEVKVYPDFLICVNGKWAVLEVDGRQHNLPDRAEADNYKRKRLALASIPMWSFPAESVRENHGAGAERVVYEFLELLKSYKS